jgi:hypothetical protein
MARLKLSEDPEKDNSILFEAHDYVDVKKIKEEGLELKSDCKPIVF